MMDPREAILTRLMQVMAGIEGIKRTFRNELDLQETDLPAIAMLDAGEEADDSDPIRPQAHAPRRVTMTPELFVILPEKSKNIGPALNVMRTRIISAVLFDAQLLALTLDGRSIRYNALQSSLSQGRQVIGDMGLFFDFTYVLRPASPGSWSSEFSGDFG